MVGFRVKKISQVNTSNLETLGQSVVDLSKYTEDEFASLSRALQQTDPDPILHVAPPKPKPGTTVYADGTNWNPGFGEGPYFFDSALHWNSMKAPSVTGYVTEAPSDGTTYGRKNAAWSRVLNLADGGTVTGPMSFSNTVGFSGTVNFTGSVTGLPTAPIYRGHISGLTLSTAGSSATFTVAAGQAVDSTNVLPISLASAMNKTTSAWAAGSGNGALDTGSIANATWYHVYLISNASGSTVDVLVSLSASAPTLPGGYTLFRRIGSMKTSGAAQWVAFTQFGDYFTLASPVLDYNSTLTTTATNITLASVPSGIIVRAKIGLLPQATGFTYISPLVATDQAPSSTAAPGFSTTFQTFVNNQDMEVETNTSQQIRGRTNATITVGVVTRGWFDYRGKNL